MKLEMIFWYYVIFINLITFAAFAVDKRAAVKHRFRISVATLLGMALAGGSIGGLAAMYLFHHKTRKKIFTIGVPLIAAAQIVIVVFLMRVL